MQDILTQHLYSLSSESTNIDSFVYWTLKPSLVKISTFFCICDARASSICNLKTLSAILSSMHSALNCQIQMQINRDITINSEYYYGMERMGDKPQHPDCSLPGKINSHLTNILEKWSKSSLMVLVWGRSPDSDWEAQPIESIWAQCTFLLRRIGKKRIVIFQHGPLFCFWTSKDCPLEAYHANKTKNIHLDYYLPCYTLPFF